MLNRSQPYKLRLMAAEAVFLQRDAMRKSGLYCRPMSVCLSVRPSVRLIVTVVCCIQKAGDIAKLLS